MRRELRGVDGDPGAVRWAIVAKRSTGHTSPVTLDAAAMTTSRCRDGLSARASSSSSTASSMLCGTGNRRSQPAPGQQGRVVLRAEDEDGRAARQRPGEHAPRVGRRAREDHGVVGAGPDESPPPPWACRTTRSSGVRRSRPPVHGRAGLEGAVDSLLDGDERRRRGGVVEVGVGPGRRASAR